MKKRDEHLEIKNIEKILKQVKDRGIIRRLDGLGRIVIPIEFRRKYGYNESEEVLISKIGDYVVIRKPKEGSYGISRNLDELGRPVIPIEIRNVLNWEEKDKIIITLYQDMIILRKENQKCILCYSEKKLQEFNQKTICEKCAIKITQQIIYHMYNINKLEKILQGVNKMNIEEKIEEKGEKLKNVCESTETSISEVMAVSNEIDKLIIEKIKEQLGD